MNATIMHHFFGVVRFDSANPQVAVPQCAAALARIPTDLPLALWGSGPTYRDDGRLTVLGDLHLVGSAHGKESAPSALDRVATAYRARGLDGLAGLRGEYAFVLVDAQAKRVVLATDRFATRQIFYREDAQGVAFATRLAALAHGEALDAQALLEYFFYQSIPTPRTPYQRVRRLPAGHCLVIDDGRARLMPYWDMNYAPRNGAARASEWSIRLRGELEAAVRRYVEAEESPSDVGAFLSGGTDSSTVAGFLRRLTGTAIPTFSIGYGEDRYNELAYARIAADWFGTTAHEHRVTAEEAFAALPQIVQHYEEPFGNSSALATYICARVAQQHGTRVLFAGDGGDELFAGNSRYQSDAVLGLYQRVPSMLRHALMDPLIHAVPDGWPLLGRVPRYVRRSNMPNPLRMLSYSLLLSAPMAQLFTPDFAASVCPQEMLAPAERHFRRPGAGTSELDRLLYLDLKLAIVDNDLRKVNGTAELAGIQVRYPLLDADLADLSGQIPSTLKLRHFRKRYIFKHALQDFLPPQILRKSKHGFGVPVVMWLRDHPLWRDFANDVFADRRTRERGYFRPEVLDDLRHRHRHEHTVFYGDILWNVLMLELWQRAHVDAQ